MTMKDSFNSSRLQTQLGLSMIELMIAIALGVVLLLGLVQIFGGVRSSFNAADSRARIQENGRFALDFIRRDARMAGHFGCRNEFHHFPSTVARALEPGPNGALDAGFSNHLIGPGALSIRDNAPYTTQAHRPIEVYDYTGTGLGATYVIATDTPAADGTAANWASLPDAGLETISARAVPGSDILVMRYFDESTATVTGLGGTTTGRIPLTATDVSNVNLFGLYGITDCNLASLFQVTALPSPTAVRAAAGGLNLGRADPTFWFDAASANELYGRGSMFYRYQFVVYYIGVGVNGPALFRQTLTEAPTTAAGALLLSTPVEVVEGVEMMQILVGIDTGAPRDDFVNQYIDANTLLTGAATPTAIDNAFRQASSLRISLLVRGNPQAGTTRTRNTIVVGDLNVTLPNDGRARQTYDATIVIRNRLRA